MKKFILLIALFFCCLQHLFSQHPADLDFSFGNRTATGFTKLSSAYSTQVLTEVNGTVYLIIRINSHKTVITRILATST